MTILIIIVTAPVFLSPAAAASVSVVAAVSVTSRWVITASRTFLWSRLLLRQVRLLNVKPGTVLPSLLPTADTDSGKSAPSESSVAS